jgi:hypothetical protein
VTPEALFTAALQLEAGWKVRECRFEGEPRRLLLKLDFEEGKRFGCPECGKLCPTHDTNIKRWRDLNFFQYECLLEARVPRSSCPEHGVLSVAVPWAREGSGFALLFEALAMLLCREPEQSEDRLPQAARRGDQRSSNADGSGGLPI